MRRLFRVLALASLLTLAGRATPVWAAVSGGELIEHPEKWDRQEVTYRGEVVGDVMRRGSTAVVNVLNGGYAVGVWLPVRMAEEIRFAGRHGVKGDVVEVHGVYHRACLDHGGDPDLHAERLTVLVPGHRQAESFHRRRAYAAAGLLLVALVLVAWEARRKPLETHYEEEEY